MIPKVVLIGSGRFGKNHLKTLLQLNKKRIIEFVGVVDLDEKVLKNIQKEHDLKVSKSIKDFLDYAEFFDVATPPKTHYKIVKYLLNNKKNVFVEKPLALKLKDAKEINSLAKKRKKILQVGHIFRYNSTIIKLKKILEKEAPYLIKGNFLQERIQSHETDSVFVFMHGFDVLDYLIECLPIRIFAKNNLECAQNKIGLNSTTYLQYPNLNASLNLGVIPEGIQRNLEIFTQKKRIFCDLSSNEIQINEKNHKIKIIKVKQKFEPLYLELRDFISLKHNAKVNGDVGVKIVKICESSILARKKNHSIRC